MRKLFVVASVVLLTPYGIQAQLLAICFVVSVACALQFVCMPYKVSWKCLFRVGTKLEQLVSLIVVLQLQAWHGLFCNVHQALKRAKLGCRRGPGAMLAWTAYIWGSHV